MGSSPERELEEQLKEAGNGLLNPPSSIDQLLNLLDKVEHLLANVEQAPSRSILDALLPSMKALISKELLRHPEMDVKVSVASCFNEITRITAPDAPYDDEQMKEIFELIVAAFENLSHESNRCFRKALSILDTVAKVRSSLVMLDLECDVLIIEMFQRFLKIIRPDHPHTVFSAMETIMTLVLDESEDISLDLLNPLLASVRKENQNVSPISWKLGEKVITNCAAILKPSLMEAVQSMGIALDDYAPVVSFICQNGSDTVQHDHDTHSGENMVTKGLEPDTICSAEVGQPVNGISKSAMSNGTAIIGSDNTISKNSSKKLERCCLAKHSKSIDARGSAEPDNLSSMKTVKLEPGTVVVAKKRCRKPNSSMNLEEKHSKSIDARGSAEPDNLSSVKKVKLEPGTVVAAKKRGWKPNSLMNPEEGYDHSWICTGKKSLKLSRHTHRMSHDKEISPSENPVSKKKASPSTQENVSEPLGCSPKISEIVGAASPSTNDTLPGGSCHRRGLPKKKECMINQDADPNSLSGLKGVLNSHLHDKSLQHADVKTRKEPEDRRNLESKPQRRSRKIEVSAKTNWEAEKETENPGDPEEKQQQQSVTNVVGNFREDKSPVQTKLKISSGYATSDKDIAGASSNKEMISKHITKSSKRVERYLEETPKTKPKRGRPAKKQEASVGLDLGERLVGSRIKVWWPMDKTFYKGVVDSFDPIKKKHMVLYVDGDQELLDLKKQRWELIGGILPHGGQETDHPKPDTSSDLLQTGKVKTKSGSVKQEKVDSSSKRGRAPASTSKLEAIKSGSLSADGLMLDKPNVVTESMDGTSRTNDRSKNGGRKSMKKLKVKELMTSKQTTVTESKVVSQRSQ